MNFNVDLKKMVRDAGTVVNRVVQMTGEKLGTSEKTELDAHFENLAERSDTTKLWTEKLLKDTEAVLTPNPGNRVEDFLFEKIEKKRPNRLSNLEYLGQDMIEAGNEFGPGTAYGGALLKVGQCEHKLGKIEREFISNANSCFLSPLRKYLDGEMKTITNERSILESKRFPVSAKLKEKWIKAIRRENRTPTKIVVCSEHYKEDIFDKTSPLDTFQTCLPHPWKIIRLDLDACKNRVRKARSMIGQPTKEGPSPEYLLQEAERDLRTAQSEFDRQVEITKLLLESVSSSHASHLRCLNDFVDAQLLYYQQCVSTVQELKNELNNMCSNGGKKTQQAKVLCGYNARGPQEISLIADEIVTIEKISDNEPDFVLAHRGDQVGRVPLAYLEVLP